MNFQGVDKRWVCSLQTSGGELLKEKPVLPWLLGLQESGLMGRVAELRMIYKKTKFVTYKEKSHTSLKKYFPLRQVGSLPLRKVGW